MNFRKINSNFHRNTKAISPVIATLLMIAIAVVASLVAYAWVMGYMNFTTQKTGNAIQIQSMVIDSVSNPQKVTFYVQNVGTGLVQFESNIGVYINGQKVTVAPTITGTDTNGALPVGSTATVVVTPPSTLVSGSYIPFKVTLQDGSIAEASKTVP
jgi:flagellin-like protein